MDRTSNWRTLIKQLFQQSPYYVHGAVHSTQPCDSEAVCIIDETHDHYMLMDVGWEDIKHVERIILHVRIKNGKIWIEDDWTKDGFANELLKAGVSHDDIVLGFQHPSMRPLTDFASA